MRKRSLFNNDWLFAADRLGLDAPDEQFKPITLPHTNKIFPHHNFDNRDYQFVSTYRKRFNLFIENEEQLVFLEFEWGINQGASWWIYFLFSRHNQFSK